VEKGVAIGAEPNYDLAPVHPCGGRICSKVYGLIDKLYDPNRVKGPLLRQNPRREGMRTPSGRKSAGMKP